MAVFSACSRMAAPLCRQVVFVRPAVRAGRTRRTGQACQLSFGPGFTADPNAGRPQQHSAGRLV